MTLHGTYIEQPTPGDETQGVLIIDVTLLALREKRIAGC